MSFASLGLSEPILRAVEAQGYTDPTPIQLQAIPHILRGHDLLGCAQTGTGKTAAFALPILHRLRESLAAADSQRPASAPRSPDHRGHADPRDPRARQQGPRRAIRCLVLAPTRELAAQIDESFSEYGASSGLRGTVIFGGVGQGNQVRDLRGGVDILVATPGRLLDLMEQGFVHLNRIEILVLDEADQMLDMGFLPALERIMRHVPRERQTLLFSATMPPEIRRLADQWLHHPIEIRVAPAGTPAELIEQSVYFVETRDKARLLVHYLENRATARTLVFTRTKHGADRVVRKLEQAGIRAAAIHGNKSQNQRLRALDAFRSERPPVLVATDIAARGLDITGISHVINFDMPITPEIYVHRIGRTGRAGAEGMAVSLCARDERNLLRQVERLTRHPLRVTECELPPSPETASHDSRGGDGQGSRDQENRERSSRGSGNRRPENRNQGNRERGGQPASSGEQPRAARPATSHAGGAARPESGARHPEGGPRHSGESRARRGDQAPRGRRRFGSRGYGA